VVENYGIPAPHAFTGRIDKVTIHLKEVDKSVDAEENGRRPDSVQKRARLDQGHADSFEIRRSRLLTARRQLRH
jgi:hypothetical protein